MSDLDDSPIEVKHDLVMPDGIYFGLDESRYHAALALSSTGIKWIRVSTLDWWARSPLNPDPDDEEDSEAKVAGNAYHKRILKGRDAFYSRYAPALDPRDHPNAIKTNDEIAQAIIRAGGPDKRLKSMRKAELIATLAQYDPEAEVWEALQEQHRARYPDREFLTARLIRKIETSAKMIEADRALSKAFTGGYSEVSIFWRDHATGTPMKARLDHWKIRAISDLKSFDPQGRPIDIAIFRAVASYKYHLQARVYLDAVRAARRLADAGLAFGDVDPGFIENFSPDPKFMFVFSAKGPAPLARGWVMDTSNTLDIARMEVDEAKIKWARCWRLYGELPWVDTAEIRTFADEDFPVYINE